MQDSVWQQDRSPENEMEEFLQFEWSYGYGKVPSRQYLYYSFG